MKKYLFATAIFFAASRADCQEYYSNATDVAHSARISSIGAQGAAQVSQLHNQAQTEIQTILVKQGDNNLKMLEAIRKENAENRDQTLLSLETLRKENAENRDQTLLSLETLRKETVGSKTQLLAVLESSRRDAATAVKYLGISLCVGFAAILSVLVAIYVQIKKRSQIAAVKN